MLAKSTYMEDNEEIHLQSLGKQWTMSDTALSWQTPVGHFSRWLKSVSDVQKGHHPEPISVPTSVLYLCVCMCSCEAKSTAYTESTQGKKPREKGRSLPCIISDDVYLGCFFVDDLSACQLQFEFKGEQPI